MNAKILQNYAWILARPNDTLEIYKEPTRCNFGSIVYQ
jgi:hypothetical protein